MLFKDYHLPMIRSGSKTETRREWADNYSRPNEESVQIATDEMFTSDDDADCYIRIGSVFDQPLGEMDDWDARAEGDYQSLDEFKDGYADVYGDDAWDPEKVVAVVKFEYVGRYRPVDPSELSVDELREQYKSIRAEMDPYAPYEEQQALTDRRVNLWNELRSRVDVNYPECPFCGNDSWYQAAGDPAYCGNCDHEADADLEVAIHEAWDAAIDGNRGEVRAE